MMHCSDIDQAEMENEWSVSYEAIRSRTHLVMDTDNDSDSLPTALTPEPGFKCPQKFGKYPKLHNDTAYNVCLAGQPFIATCPYGQVFDAGHLMCINEFDSKDCPSCKIEVDCADGRLDGMYPLRSTCEKFQVCCRKFGYVRSCPIFHKFDIITMQCQPEELATCLSIV